MPTLHFYFVFESWGLLGSDCGPRPSVLRGERVNGGHLREMQAKTKTTRKVETLHERAFSLKGILLKYAV
jgi:hypothetical protein